MKIEVEIKPIGFTVLDEKDVISEDLDIIECIMQVEFCININDIQKVTFGERIKATYFNTMTGVEMDEARELAIKEYIYNLTVVPKGEVKEEPIIIEEKPENKETEINEI